MEVYRITGKAFLRIVYWNEGSLRSRLCLVPVPRTVPKAMARKYFLKNLVLLRKCPWIHYWVVKRLR